MSARPYPIYLPIPYIVYFKLDLYFPGDGWVVINRIKAKSVRLALDGQLELNLAIVATTSLPVNRLSATDCNAAARANIQTTQEKDSITTSKELYSI